LLAPASLSRYVLKIQKSADPVSALTIAVRMASPARASYVWLTHVNHQRLPTDADRDKVFRVGLFWRGLHLASLILLSFRKAPHLSLADIMKVRASILRLTILAHDFAFRHCTIANMVGVSLPFHHKRTICGIGGCTGTQRRMQMSMLSGNNGKA